MEKHKRSRHITYGATFEDEQGRAIDDTETTYEILRSYVDFDTVHDTITYTHIVKPIGEA